MCKFPFKIVKMIRAVLNFVWCDYLGDLIIKFKPVFPLDLSNDKLEKLKELFPPINITKHSEEIKNYELELVTESDFEFSDDESSDEDDLDDDFGELGDPSP